MALESLLARHREPHRRYHGLAHLTAVVRHVEHLVQHVDGVDDPDAVRMAAFFHDAVYDPRSSDNEAASATLARTELVDLGWPDERAERVADLVRATEHTGTPAATTAVEGDTADRDVLVDADLAILGAEPAVYAAYTAGVRAEYSHVDDEGWRHGRSTVLRRLLSLDPVFRTEPMRAARERRARANIAAELADLIRER